MKKIMITSVLAIALFAVVEQSMAECRPSDSQVTYMHQREDGWTRVYVQLNNQIGNGIHYWFWTQDDSKIDMLSDALGSGKTVRIVGSAGSCPTSGNVRYGGHVKRLDVARNR